MKVGHNVDLQTLPQLINTMHHKASDFDANIASTYSTRPKDSLKSIGANSFVSLYPITTL